MPNAAIINTLFFMKTQRKRFNFFLSFYKLILLIIWCGATSTDLYAYSLRQFTSKNGLSNSAIPFIYQDKSSIIWIGSCDGLNSFDGNRLGLYKPINSDLNLSGNLIDNIVEAQDNVLWIRTNYGLNRLDTRRQTIRYFDEFKGINKMIKGPDNTVYILKDDGHIYYFREKDSVFYRLEVADISFEDVCQITVDSSNIFWVFFFNGESRSYVLQNEETGIKTVEKGYFHHNEKLLCGFAEGDLFYFVDSSYGLYEYDFRNRKEYYVADLEEQIRSRGEISSIIKQRNDYYIGFKINGLVQLKYLPNQKVKYEVLSINIQSGVFCMVKDRFQDILWVGTDGQGVYMYFGDTFSVTNYLLDTPVYQVNNPVRSLFLDQESTLWVGTKGGGILRLLDFQPGSNHTPGMQRLLTTNSVLADNSVYCFARSRWKRLWIGTEMGINYYSYQDKSIREFPIMADGKVVKYVHSICEMNDSTLWISTVGEGIVKVVLNTSGSQPTVRSAKRTLVKEGKPRLNYFFVSYQENDSIIWFGNRGNGAYRINSETGSMSLYAFDQLVQSQLVNEVFAIHKNEEGYWFGSSYGLVRFHLREYHIFNESDGLPNNTIHGILEDGLHNLWLSTNQGLVRFNVRANTIQSYRQQNNLEVIEFSDGAYFKDESSGTLFFGGTNGFVTVNESEVVAKEYLPALRFNRLSIFGKDYNLYDFLQNSEGQEILELDYSQNFFGLSFVAIDYVNGNNYSYSYKINGLSDNWVENGFSTTAVFSNLAPGKYTLLVKYRSNITGDESEPQALIIYITPPWYMTRLACAIYLLMAVGLVLLGIYQFRRRYRAKQDAVIEKMNRQQRDELYESKLRFFTNLTHEFCTPLTLIYGPCEKVLSYSATDSYIHKYVMMIQQNAKKLNALILELIEFRRLETGHKTLVIQPANVAEQMRNMAESFNELAERKRIDYQIRAGEILYWNTDSSCLSKIVNNLLSNAFKYTPDKGLIRIEQYFKEGKLYLRVSNSGKGIEKENLTKIFDRYKILDNFEVQQKDGFSPRNGLGLAICHSMVTLLNGEISVTSVLNEITTFEVTLPFMAVTYLTEEKKRSKDVVSLSDDRQMELKNISVAYDISKFTIFVIDDDPSMLWFVSEVFVDKYNVLSFGNAEEALEQLYVKLPNLIISDVMMPGLDGMSFAKRLKSDQSLSHIPLVLLSALNDMDEQVKGIESGAEAYVTKPFNVDYLEKIVSRLIQRKEDLKTYFNSVYSSFELDDGRFLHKDDRSFFDTMMQVIAAHIHQPEFTIDMISDALGYSTRQFYRRLKLITDKTPMDIIKDYRLTLAEHLLLTSNFSVEEILYKVGFVNRGTFHRLFLQKYGMSPRQYRREKRKNLNSQEGDSARN